MRTVTNRFRPGAQRAPADRSRVPQGWRLVLVIGSLSIFGPLCIDMYLPALPRISTDLHASTSAVQFSVTGCLIGIAAGQLIIGPISDQRGRRSPLLFGLLLFIGSSIACSLVSSTYLLDVFRLLQGLGGAAGIVIARAIVRDLFEGPTAARFFSTLMLVTGLGPIIAPQLGAFILRFTSWRGIFLVLAVAGGILLVIALIKVPETLPVERRHTGGLRQTVRTMVRISRDKTFVGYTAVVSLGFGAILVYIAGASFILQGVYGLSAQVFSVVFGINAAGMVIAAQINGRFVHRHGSAWLLTRGLSLMAAGSAIFLVAAGTHWGGLAVVMPALFIVISGLGFVGPNATALALQNHADAAGAASALLGSVQFLFGALIAPLAGVAGNHNALPMGILMVVLAGGAIAVRLALGRSEDAGAGASERALVEPAAIDPAAVEPAPAAL